MLFDTDEYARKQNELAENAALDGESDAQNNIAPQNDDPAYLWGYYRQQLNEATQTARIETGDEF